MRKSEVEKQLRGLTAKIRNLQARLRALEKASEVNKKLRELTGKIKKLENRLRALESAANPDVLGILREHSRKRLGRRPKVDIHVLLRRREKLVDLFEENWPELSLDIRKATEPRHLAKALERLPKRCGGYEVPLLEAPGEHCETMWGFVQSHRYHGNPRNLANAMAGIPEMKWKRSFDQLSSTQYRYGGVVGIRAIRDHLHRNFPLRLKELLVAKTTEEVSAILARSPSNDVTYEMLKQRPEMVLEWLRDGLPRRRSRVVRRESGKGAEARGAANL